MPRYVAFLRAINVGGHTVKMDRLRRLFEELDLANVETFIASGNVLFDAPARANTARLEERIEQHLAQALGYDVATFVRPLESLAGAAADHPFAMGVARGYRLHLGFLKQQPSKSQHAALMTRACETEEFHVGERTVYWLCHTGIGESKLTNATFEKALGGPTTFRNINTVQRLADKGASSKARRT